MIAHDPIACLGAGRMGRGIAVVFAYAGHEVVVVDCKPREHTEFARLAASAQDEIGQTLRSLARFGLFDEAHVAAITARATVVPESDAGAALSSAAVIFEAVPELLELKRAALARVCALAGPMPIIASTTSTILAD
jgi:3-hydroxybutyryl-CoA dehydrogenase